MTESQPLGGSGIAHRITDLFLRIRSAATVLVLSVVVAALAGCGGTADLVVTNGHVVTVDEDLPEAEAVAVRGDRILAVGTAEEIDRYIGGDTEVIDAGGRLVIPGFIDGHAHFSGVGRAQMILDLTKARTWDEIVEMVAAAAEEAEPGEWITGRGWHQEKWDTTPSPAVEGMAVHTSLSAVTPDNPVSLTHASGHASFVNAKAMELAGIDRDTPDPDGGTIVRDESGEPTGLLRETASGLVGRAMSRARQDRTEEERDAEMRRMVELAGEELWSKGITGFHDAGASFATIDFYRSLAEAGELPVRLNVMVGDTDPEEMDARLPEYRLKGIGNHFLTVGTIKQFMDGALGSHGAWLLEPYSDMPSTSGLNTTPVDHIREIADLAVKHGFQVGTHAIGDRANREVLDIYEAAFQEAGVDGTELRWRVEHAQHLHPDDVPRFAEMGIIAAMQAIHCTSDGPWVPDRLGEERARTGAYVWRDLLDAGVVIANGTDAPVEDVNPIPSFYASVSRMMPNGERFYPDQAMTRMEALRSYTINPAYASFEEDIKGSLTPGKLADIVVLDTDIMTVPEEEIPGTRPVYTILGGEVVYRNDAALGGAQ